LVNIKEISFFAEKMKKSFFNFDFSLYNEDYDDWKGEDPVTIEEKILVEMALRVRYIRKYKHLTQLDLSSESGVPYASIRKFETTGQISFLGLLKIAHALEEFPSFEKVFNHGCIYKSIHPAFFKKRISKKEFEDIDW
jgi:hypothetical protein